jgi:CO dehydrogenase maturation factor
LIWEARTVLAVDADINQHLAVALGATEADSAALPTLSAELLLIKDYLRGANPRIASAAVMVKTTRPGVCPGGRWGAAGCDRLVCPGRPGVACYHSKVGAVELLLNHLVDDVDEYLVVT